MCKSLESLKNYFLTKKLFSNPNPLVYYCNNQTSNWLTKKKKKKKLQYDDNVSTVKKNLRATVSDVTNNFQVSSSFSKTLRAKMQIFH